MTDTSLIRTCSRCSTSFQLAPWDARRGRGKFCGVACYRAARTEKPYTYHALHTWLWRNYRDLKTGSCKRCGQARRTDWANVSGKYRKDIGDYIELCKPCHEAYDGKRHDLFRGHRHTDASKRRIAASVRKNRWGIV